MKVKAKKTGYYGIVRRSAGTVFVIEKDEEFSEKWMEAVNDDGQPLFKPEKPRKEVEAFPESEMVSGNESVL